MKEWIEEAVGGGEMPYFSVSKHFFISTHMSLKPRDLKGWAVFYFEFERLMLMLMLMPISWWEDQVFFLFFLLHTKV